MRTKLIFAVEVSIFQKIGRLLLKFLGSVGKLKFLTYVEISKIRGNLTVSVDIPIKLNYS